MTELKMQQQQLKQNLNQSKTQFFCIKRRVERDQGREQNAGRWLCELKTYEALKMNRNAKSTNRNRISGESDVICGRSGSAALFSFYKKQTEIVTENNKHSHDSDLQMLIK